MRKLIARVGVILVLLVGVAHADVAPDPVPPPPPTPSVEVTDGNEVTVAVARDGDARGWEQAPKGSRLRGKIAIRVLGKVASYFARVFVVYPVRFVAYLQARWKVFTRIRDVFQNDEGTLAIYPIAAYSSAFGLTLGATTFYKDWGGNAERVTLSASAGGDVVQAYQGTLEMPRISGTRFYMRSRLRYEKNRNVPFEGIGNGDLTMGTGLDARDAQIATRFAQERFLATASGGIDLGDAERHTRLGISVIFNDRSFGPAPEELVSIEEVYDTSTIAGFDGGFQNLELTADLEIDTRDRLGPTRRGGVMRGFAGAGRPLGQRPFAHYGAEVAYHFEPFWPLRIVVLRAAVEAVYARDGVIPFTELPRLGGVNKLRGFGTDQFRDRLSAIGTVEYRYPIHHNIAGHLFAEVGRVARTYGDLATIGIADWHLGYGGGLIIRIKSVVKFRVDLAYGSAFQFYFSTDVLDAFRSREDEL